MEAYPLQWPLGYPRTTKRRDSLFSDHTLTHAQGEVKYQLSMMGAKDIIISTNIPLRKDGLPHTDYQRRIIADTGVAVYFKRKDKQCVLACDKWITIEENLWAIAKSIDSMRGLDRWGVSDILDRTFQGFNALPMIATGINPWDILDIEPTRDKDIIIKRYKELAKIRQFDEAQMRDLNTAKDLVLKDL